MRKKGVPIEKVAPGSPAYEAGLRGGDVLVTVNGSPVSDPIDYMFHASEPGLKFKVEREGSSLSVELEVPEGREAGIKLADFRIKTCRNNCVFCFVSQLPRGLRKPLYVKDDDYRMSFLYGNYATLTNLSEADWQRTTSQRLSPLYISVHTTNNALRRKMLGNPKAPDIMKDLRRLRDHRIQMHAQIVLCPGLNDRDELKNTIRDLGALYPYVESIAVVPVGLTAHGKQPLAPVEKKDAEDALAAVEAFQKRFRKKHGDPVVYAADELYIKAGRPFPPLKDYGDLPQVENGVGMVPLFLSQARRLALPEGAGAGLKALTFTGTSFYPLLRKFTDRLRRQGIDVTPVQVENTSFGNTVTVAGLLTGRDVIRALAARAREFDVLLVPDCVFKDDADVFLDDVTVDELEGALGIRASVIEPTPEGLVKGGSGQ